MDTATLTEWEFPFVTAAPFILFKILNKKLDSTVDIVD